MITVKECEALCEADPGWVNELASRECLGMVQAYARADEAAVCANEVAMAARPPADRPATDFRRTA